MRAASKGVETADCAPAATRSNTAQESTAQQTQKTHSPPAATGEGCTHTYTATPSPQRRADAHGYRWRPKGLSTPSALSLVQVRPWLLHTAAAARTGPPPGAVVRFLPPEPSFGPRLFARSLRWFLGYCTTLPEPSLGPWLVAFGGSSATATLFPATSPPPPRRIFGLRSKQYGGRLVDQGMRCCCALGPQTLLP